MNRIRARQKRTPRFEALEGRLVLSTGMGTGVISHQAHALVMSQPQRQVSASFRGHVTTSGSTVTTTGLTGTIGRDHFTGSGTGMTSGTIFQGGYVYLSNSKGTITLRSAPPRSLKSVNASGKRSQPSPSMPLESILSTLEALGN